MSLSEGVVFTLLPNGVTDDGKLRFSVFVSPRLTPSEAPSSGTLAEFGGFSNESGGWPGTLQSLQNSSSFSVVFNGATPPGKTATLVTTPLDPSLWGMLFPGTTPVNPYTFTSLPNFTILSYPVKNLHAFIQNQYQLAALSTASSKTTPPPFPSLAELTSNGLGQIGIFRPAFNYFTDEYGLINKFPDGTHGTPNIAPNIMQSDIDGTITSLLKDSAVGLAGRQALDYRGPPYTTQQIGPYSLFKTINGLTVQPQIDFEQVRLFYQNLAHPYGPNTSPMGANPNETFIPDSTSANAAHGDLKAPTLDFHKQVSGLSQYTGTTDSPGLLRKLGLVFDLTVPIPTGLPSTGTVSLYIPPPPPTAFSIQNFMFPQTAYLLDTSQTPTSFTTASEGGSTDLTGPTSGSGSMLNLTNGNFTNLNLDIDAAAMKTSQFADLLLRLLFGVYLKAVSPSHNYGISEINTLSPITAENASIYSPQSMIAPDTPQSLSLPSLKSGGISISRVSRGYALASTLNNADMNNSNLTSTPPTTLHAEDVVRGYRVDVWNNTTSTWLSLCNRVGTYIVGPPTSPPSPTSTQLTLADEGWISLGATYAAVDPTNPPSPAPSISTINLHENMIRWKGWSLCAPRPAGIRRVSQDNTVTNPAVGEPGYYSGAPVGAPVGGEVIDSYDPNRAAADANASGNNSIPLSVTFAALAGTLPALRFGTTYQMRARAVDMAGNSLAYNDPTIEGLSKPWVTTTVAYTRFEPVQPPTVVLRTYLNPASTAFAAASVPAVPAVQVTTSNYPNYNPTTYVPPTDNNPELHPITITVPYTIPPEPSTPEYAADSQDSPGEQLGRLVIRSNYASSKSPSGMATGTAAEYAAYLNTLPALNSLDFQRTGYLAVSERNIVPPRTTESMAELLGALDDNTKTPPVLFGNPNASYLDIWQRDLWAFDQYKNYIGDTFPPATPTTSTPQYLNAPAQLLITTPDDKNVHYLADPMAQGACLTFFDVDGNPLFGGNPVPVPFYPPSSLWPQLELFKLSLQESGGVPPGTAPFSLPTAPAFGSSIRSLVVSLPKGTWVDIQLSSYLSSTDATPSRMGILNWANEAVTAIPPLLTSGDVTTLKNLTMSGQFWMITPYRKLRLIHAVQQPVNAPNFWYTPPQVLPKPPIPAGLGLQDNRGLGWTYAELSGTIQYHGSSTAKLDLLAAWEEPTDNPPLPVEDGRSWSAGQPPAVYPPSSSSAGGVHHFQHVFQFSQLDPGWSFVTFQDGQLFVGPFPYPPSVKHEFGDTKRRLVRYTLAATTRFLEYLPDQVWKEPSVAKATPSNPPYSQPILDQNNLPQYLVRYINDQPDNTQWTGSKGVGTGWVLDIPSTARPQKPLILYVVPTFTWTRTGTRTAKALTSGRTGGFRVYMDRPWYSSGFDELLGVILWQGTGTTPPDPLQHLVTQWGMDPLWAVPSTASITQQPAENNFFNTSSIAKPTTAVLEETGNNVTVVPFDVGFDNTRNLWYADIEIGQPAGLSFTQPWYYPFIRLALVRYQPNSLTTPENVSISPVVLADYMQITPDRYLIVTQTSPTKLVVALGGTFPEYSAQFNPASKVLVLVQSRQSGVSDPDLGWTNVGSEVYLEPGVVSGIQVFEGSITLPSPRGTPGTDLRLVVAEYEQYNVDTPSSTPILQPLPGLRLVYVETVLI